jgi:hypothetical protein
MPQHLIGTLDLFRDVLSPILAEVPTVPAYRKIARLVDAAVLFGVIQEREGTGGFRSLATGELRRWYFDKVAYFRDVAYWHKVAYFRDVAYWREDHCEVCGEQSERIEGVRCDDHLEPPT